MNAQASTKQSIVNDILTYMKECGGSAREWYVGIATNATNRLFSDHGVNESNGAWIYRTADSSDDAREIEQYFINRVGTDGGSGGGDGFTKMVYAYKKSTASRP
ncbi:MAG: hypothetical protein L6Q31_11755 [Fimbriimonadaceae bacterium]|uniref:Uncharacterized protein n=1 Tax=Candidatus Nitrosymbiomonas proteolyticus TaxID=2608984 RepID=A0A809RA58_9BACT|nr:hypothetical protein [Fimbriimonadaceae bacterium]BBO24370.1 conserved hypothetical protein [Candidatus Nitrosymbiomonas proteolyticus]